MAEIQNRLNRGFLGEALGHWRLRHDQTIIRLDRFGSAYLFAPARGVVRFFGVR